MTTERRMVCLGAGSWGDGVHLLGRELDEAGRPGAWLRLVAPDHTETVTPEHACVAGGDRVAPLDVIRVAVGDSAAEGYLTESVRLAGDEPIARDGRLDPGDVLDALDDGRVLGRHTDSSGEGQNDRIPYLYTLFMQGSLALLRPDEADLLLDEATRGTPTGARVIFRDQGRRYNLMVTDRAALARMADWRHGTHRLTAPLLCVTVSAPVALAGDTYSYRLVPGLMPT